jgi:TRAP-type uncharacterized transport system fused permease subunit
MRFHLTRRPRLVALVAHVLTSVGWFGVAVLVVFLLVAAGSTGDDALARSLYRAVETSVWLTVPIGVLAAATGVVLGLGTKWGLARYWWVVIKEVAVVPVVVTDLLVVAPAAHDGAQGQLSGRLLDPAIADVVVLGLATVVSLVKPFGRTARGRRGEPATVATPR